MDRRISAFAVATALSIMVTATSRAADGMSAYPEYTSSATNENPWREPSVAELVARRAEARMQRLHAELALPYEFRKMRFEFERSAEYRQLAWAARQAFAKYQEARNSVLDRLSGDPVYTALVRRRDELTEKILAAHAANEVDSATVTALAKEKLHYASMVTDIETRRLATDQAVQLSREEHQLIGGELAFMRAEFDASTRYHPNIESLRGRLNTARVQSVTAAALAQATIRERQLERRVASYQGGGGSTYGHHGGHDGAANCGPGGIGGHGGPGGGR